MYTRPSTATDWQTSDCWGGVQVETDAISLRHCDSGLGNVDLGGKPVVETRLKVLKY